MTMLLRENPKTVIGIRCHVISDVERNFYNAIKEMVSGDIEVFFVKDCCNNTAGDFYDQSFVEMSQSVSLIEDLYFPENVGWLCGDYFYFALMNSVDADFYWLVEPDVKFSDGASDFFLKFQDDSSDFLSIRFGRKDKNWYWFEFVSDYFDEVYGCSFPVTRMSKKAVEYVLEQRRRFTCLKKSNEISRFPNDESLVSTSIKNAGYKCRDVTSIYLADYSGFSTMIPRLAETLNASGAAIWHPVLNWSEFKKKFPVRLTAALRNNKGDEFLSKSLNGLDSIKVSEVILSSIDVFESFSRAKE
ncbi:MAG: hypothetical protein SCL54_15635 [Bacillota bacterium]|nr:hypothetical protein [Bacillota bacterium]